MQNRLTITGSLFSWLALVFAVFVLGVPLVLVVLWIVRDGFSWMLAGSAGIVAYLAYRFAWRADTTLPKTVSASPLIVTSEPEQDLAKLSTLSSNGKVLTDFLQRVRVMREEHWESVIERKRSQIRPFLRRMLTPNDDERQQKAARNIILAQRQEHVEATVYALCESSCPQYVRRDRLRYALAWSALRDAGAALIYRDILTSAQFHSLYRSFAAIVPSVSSG